jgi:hypothetical protein
VVVCCHCGIQFAVPVSWIQERRTDHAGFRCPNGHSLKFREKTEIDEAREDLHKVQAMLNEEKHARIVLDKQLKENQDEMARLKNRVTHGVCLCCNRTFENLAEHMKSQHPAEIPGHQQKQIAGGATIELERLEVGVRCYNGLKNLYTGHGDINLNDILNARPLLMRNFGRIAFRETITALLQYGISRDTVTASVFWRSVPGPWKINPPPNGMAGGSPDEPGQ